MLNRKLVLTAAIAAAFSLPSAFAQSQADDVNIEQTTEMETSAGDVRDAVDDIPSNAEINVDRDADAVTDSAIDRADEAAEAARNALDINESLDVNDSKDDNVSEQHDNG